MTIIKHLYCQPSDEFFVTQQKAIINVTYLNHFCTFTLHSKFSVYHNCNEMSLRTKVLRLVEIVLRVPPLFIIDEILKIGIVLSDFTEHDLSGFEQSFEEDARNASSTIQYNPTFYKLVLAAFIRFMLCMCGKISNQESYMSLLSFVLFLS